MISPSQRPLLLVAALFVVAGVFLSYRQGSVSTEPSEGELVAGAACGEHASCDEGHSCVYGLCWQHGKMPQDSYVYSPQYQEDTDLFRQIVVGALELKAGMHVAEIGAGSGVLTFRTALLVKPGGRVYATDIDPSVVRRLREKLREVELDNVDVRLVRAERDTGLEDVAPGTVDRVLITDSLMFEHGRDRHEDVAYLRSLGELLRKEGELLYHIDWVEVGRHLDREEIIALFRDAGFSATVREIPKPKHIPETATLYHSAGDKIIRLPLKRGFILLFHRD